jgi:hypothetical protein
MHHAKMGVTSPSACLGLRSSSLERSSLFTSQGICAVVEVMVDMGGHGPLHVCDGQDAMRAWPWGLWGVGLSSDTMSGKCSMHGRSRLHSALGQEARTR